MRVAIVSSFDLDGGAAKAAYRLHGGLRAAGHDSRMFVQVRSPGTDAVDGPLNGPGKWWGRLRPQLDHVPAWCVGAPLGVFSVNWLPSGLASRLAAFNPDVVHLHGIHGGYVALSDIARLGRPLVWTAHDMWPFTGGCHYDAGCGRFQAGACRACPMATRWPGAPLAALRLSAKADLQRVARPVYVCPSHWLAEVARSSVVARDAEVLVIPNGLDLTRFKPIDKAAARSLFALPADKTILLFGAVNANGDPRKGFDLLDAAIAQLAGTPQAQDLLLCVYGSNQRGTTLMRGIPVVHTGHLHDDEALVALYSAADLFVAPSRQDNLANTVLEATACGLPTVTFAIGGMPDMVIDGQTGWLAPVIDGAALAAAMLWALASADGRARASVAARALAVARFSEQTSVDAHLSAYTKAQDHAIKPRH